MKSYNPVPVAFANVGYCNNYGTLIVSR